MVLGQDQDSPGGGFNASQAYVGDLDDLWLYRRVLSAEAIRAIYEGGPVDRRDLAVHYMMNEGRGTTLNDSSGSGNHGTINGANWITGQCHD